MARSTNNFDFKILRKHYDECQVCFWCGQHGADAFHHNERRQNRFANSILNAIPLHNQKCHINIHGHIQKKEIQQMFFEMNIKHLHQTGYKMNELDIEYLNEYADKYKPILLDFLSKL